MTDSRYELRAGWEGTVHVVDTRANPAAIVVANPYKSADTHTRALCGNVFRDEGDANTTPTCNKCQRDMPKAGIDPADLLEDATDPGAA
jgi:hypothetical protein